MSVSYKVILDASEHPQSVQDLSFKGGLPNLPDRFDLPYCHFCQLPLTFFFQIAFPEKHVWQGRIMAFFYCTALEHGTGPCGYEDDWVDIVYTEDYKHLPDGILDSYQKNFCTYVFNADEETNLQGKFAERIAFERLTFEPIDPNERHDGVTKVGGKIAWCNFPSDAEHADMYKEITYMGGGVDFLMQFSQSQDWRFKRLPDAPYQHQYQYKRPDAGNQIYRLFRGAPLKFFGTNSPQLDPPRVLMYMGH